MTHKQFAWVVGTMHALLVPSVLLGALACSQLRAVTPEQRAAGYAREAETAQALCKTYRFDRSVGLVGDVPSMTELCQ